MVPFLRLLSLSLPLLILLFVHAAGIDQAGGVISGIIKACS